jgi:hypothetical protein
MPAESPGPPIWTEDVWATVWEENVWDSDSGGGGPEVGDSTTGVAAIQAPVVCGGS